MNSEKIPFSEIQRIAREVVQGYNPKELPSLEQISWAFPVEGKDCVYYNRMGYINRIPNTQEGNAIRQLMNFKNVHNVLTFLAEGKTSHQTIPHHTGFVGDAEDAGYMIYSYLHQRDAMQGKEGVKMENGLFWESMPEELTKLMLRVEGTGRGKVVDEWGEEIERKGSIAYVDANLTRQYLQNIREASEHGREYLQNLLTQKDKAENYNQLVVDVKPELWTPETQFQWAFYSRNIENPNDNGARLIIGKVLSSPADKVNVKIGKQNTQLEIEKLKGFGEKGMLWRLVPAKK